MKFIDTAIYINQYKIRPTTNIRVYIDELLFTEFNAITIADSILSPEIYVDITPNFLIHKPKRVCEKFKIIVSDEIDKNNVVVSQTHYDSDNPKDIFNEVMNELKIFFIEKMI